MGDAWRGMTFVDFRMDRSAHIEVMGIERWVI